MNNPSTVQKRVLRAITRQAVQARKLVVRSERDNGHADAVRSPAYHRVVLQLRDLEAVAAAGGVPREWVDQTRYRGELGMAWRPDLYWREPVSIDRPGLLTAVGTDVRQVREIAAVAAAYGQRGALAEAGTAQLFARNFDALARRVAALAHLLNLSADEAERLWGRESTWAEAADRVRRESEVRLQDRWRAVARLDTRTAARQVAALAEAGIGAGFAGNPAPSAAHMVQRIEQLLHDHTGHPAATGPAAGPQRPAAPMGVTSNSPRDRYIEFSAPLGDQITESVDAVGLVRDFRPVFRSPADPEPVPPAVMTGGLEP